MENRNYKKENIERKYFKTVIKNHFLKAKYSILKLENREMKMKKEELFIKKNYLLNRLIFL